MQQDIKDLRCKMQVVLASHVLQKNSTNIATFPPEQQRFQNSIFSRKIVQISDKKLSSQERNIQGSMIFLNQSKDMYKNEISHSQKEKIVFSPSNLMSADVAKVPKRALNTKHLVYCAQFNQSVMTNPKCQLTEKNPVRLQNLTFIRKAFQIKLIFKSRTHRILVKVSKYQWNQFTISQMYSSIQIKSDSDKSLEQTEEQFEEKIRITQLDYNEQLFSQKNGLPEDTKITEDSKNKEQSQNIKC